MKRTNLLAIISLLIVFSFSSCQQSKKKFYLAAANRGTSNFQAGELISNDLKHNLGIQLLMVDSCSGSIDNLSKVMDGEADFAIIQNSLNYKSLKYTENEINHELRTVIPLYSQNLFVIYPDSLEFDNIFELFEGKRVGMGPSEGGTAWLVKKVLRYFDIDTNHYTPVYTEYTENVVCTDIDISCSVTSFNNPRIINLMSNKHLKMYSFDKLSNVTIKGSVVDGISLKNTTLTPVIIPKYTYYNKPLEPVLTIATKGVLVCRKDVSDDIIYDITESIIDNKTLIVNKDAIFNDIHEEINTDNLRFPLHNGVKMYLDRAKPSFLQKYAEVMALIITITVLLFGGLTSLSNWQKQRKKDRIDIYYQKVINLDPAINDAKSSQQLHNIETQLFFIRDEAFDLLIKEKLSADESFNIFLRVLETSISRIHKKIDSLS